MKKVILLFLIGLNFFAFGQKNEFVISGVVTDCKTKQALKNVPVKIVCSDGSAIEKETDEKGNYTILIVSKRNAVSYVLTCNMQSGTTQIASCWAHSNEKIKFSLDSTTAKNRIENFCLVNMGKLEEIKFPDLFYKYMQAEPIKTKTDAINQVATIMLNNPTFVIGIDAHSGETDGIAEKSDSIQLLRSEYIKKQLIQKGIEPERLVLTKHRYNHCGYNPTEADVKSIKTKEDRTRLWGKIRHISFTVERKDYLPKQK